MERYAKLADNWYKIANYYVNESNRTVGIEDGMYNYLTIQALENAGYTCTVDKAEERTLKVTDPDKFIATVYFEQVCDLKMYNFKGNPTVLLVVNPSDDSIITMSLVHSSDINHLYVTKPETINAAHIEDALEYFQSYGTDDFVFELDKGDCWLHELRHDPFFNPNNQQFRIYILTYNI